MQFTEKRLRVKRYGRPVVASRVMLVPGWGLVSACPDLGIDVLATANRPGTRMQRRGCRPILIGLGCW
jgi:hypothetical protein